MIACPASVGGRHASRSPANAAGRGFAPVRRHRRRSLSSAPSRPFVVVRRCRRRAISLREQAFRSPSTFAVCLVAEWPPPAPPCSLACALGLDQSPCSTARVLSSRLAAAELRAGMGGRGSKLPPFDGEVLLEVNPLFRFPFLCFFPLRSPLASPCRSAPPLVRLLSTPGHTTPVNPDCRNGVSCCLAGADLRIQAGQCGAVEATLHTTLVRVPALFVPLSVLRERERERERERASERARESSERVQERAIRRSSCHAKSSARQNLVGAMG